MNKKGNIFGIIAFFLFVAFIIVAGFVLVFGAAIFDFVFDIAVPELTGFGVIDGTNVTEITDITLKPLNTVIQSFEWAAAVIYMILLISTIAFGVIVSRNGVSGWLLGMFIGLSLIIVLVSILMSNIYEDFYNDSGDLADRLKDQKLLSFMVLYSPPIIIALIFIVGIIMFSGIGKEEIF
jgi:hypothetical protein